ncbi:melanocortin receptor 5-like [Haliotis rubra]|uniref:melanocortin receptor 5-like n=1 Tax=Haliotis rubra TaxID=36100 RepID=UPI001EE614C3|nr:melanocortin receptor 5-like [Haliotis rubra]
MPTFKKAKAQNKKAVLVRDKLYIDGKLHLGPAESPARQESLEDEIEDQIANYMAIGKVFLVEDFTSWTQSKPDYITDDNLPSTVTDQLVNIASYTSDSEVRARVNPCYEIQLTDISPPEDTCSSNSCKNGSRWKSVMLVQILIGAWVILENVLTIVTLAKCRRIKTFLRLLLINQSVSDTMVGFFFTYHSVAVYNHLHNPTECIIRCSVLALSSSVSLVTITVLSMERIIAVKFPSRHYKLDETRVMTSIGVVTWLFPVCVVSSAYSFADTNIQECNFLLLATSKSLFVFATTSLPCIILVFLCNVYMFFVARQQIRKIIPNFVGRERYINEINMNMKAMLTSASVVVPFLILNTPQYLFFLTVAVRPNLRYLRSSITTLNILFSLLVLNSVINPIIYAFRVDGIRETFIKYICRKTPSPLPQAITS